MEKYAFTFGHGQPGFIGHEGSYVVLEATSFEEARNEMFKMCGRRWCMQHDVEVFKSILLEKGSLPFRLLYYSCIPLHPHSPSLMFSLVNISLSFYPVHLLHVF